MSKQWVTSVLKVLIIISLLFFGCKKNPTKSTPKEEVVISNLVVVVPDSTMNKLDHIDSTIYYFSKNATDLLSLQSGRIIVNGMGSGILRKVDSVYQAGSYIVVETQGARLDEVIVKGGFSIDIVLSPDKLDNVKSLKGLIIKPEGDGFYIDFDNVIWTDPQTGAEIRITGNATYNSSVKFGLKYDYGLDTLGFVMMAEKTASLNVTASKSITLLDKQINVAPPITFTPITIWVGVPPIVIPVVIVPKLYIVLGAEASLQGGITTGVTFADTISGGVQYKNGIWTPQFSYKKNFGFNPPQLSAGGEVKGYTLVPKIVLFVYDVAGPTASFKGHVRCYADLFSEPWWTLYAGLGLEAGVELDILGLIVADYHVTLFETEWELAHAPTDTAPAPPILSSPANGDTGVSTNPTLSWNASSGATSYTLQVSTNSSFTSFVVNQSGIATTSYPVSGLSNSSTYYWRVNATNSYGTSEWSSIWSFTTLAMIDTTPPASITNLAASDPTSSSITLTWTAPGDDGNSDTASEYDIRYSSSTITETNWDSVTRCSGEPTPKPAGNSESFVVTGLNPNTTYYFAIKTADEVPNWSIISNVPSDTTTPGGALTLLDFESVPDTYWYYGGNTNLGGFYSGVYFGPDATILEDLVYGYNSEFYPPHSGHQVLFSKSNPTIRMDFTGGFVNYVEAWYTSYTTFYMEAYNSSDVLIASTSGSSNYGSNSLLSVSSSNFDIAYVLFHDAGDFYALDDIAYNLGTNARFIEQNAQ